MKQLLLLCCYCLGYLSGFGQQEGAWHSFWNSDTTLFGFKDTQGQIIIQPRYSSIFFVRRMDHIAALAEEKGNKWEAYYLTRSGRQVARDSLYFFDNASDCESEGFIRFRDAKTDKAGMLNRNGKIVIPAEYNDLSPVHNGMVIALRDARKQHWDTTHSDGCDHFSWTGGRELLIDTANHILIDSFPYNAELDLSSLQISSRSKAAADRSRFRGTDGKFYYFTDMDREFARWLQTALLPDLSAANLVHHSFTELCIWKEEEGWIFHHPSELIARNLPLLQAILQDVRDKKVEFDMVSGSLNQFIYDSDLYHEFYNNCGNAESWRYPVKSIIVNHKGKNDFTQDHFDFLRTPQGYKLISFSLGKDTLQ